MKKKKYDIKYSAEDIRKYLDGKLSNQEMQALEKSVLEDPFLSDAIDGIEESRNHSVSFESGVEDLQKRLTKRIREKNRKSGMIMLFSKWRIAASVIFITGIATLTLIYINKNSRRSDMAKSVKIDSIMEISGSQPARKKTDTPAKSYGSSLHAIPASGKNDIAFNQPTRIGNKSVQKKLSSLNKNKLPDSLNKKPDDHSSAYLSKPSSDTTTEPTSLTSVANNDVPASPIMESVKINEDKNKSLSRSAYRSLPGNYIKGVVIDEKGNPIPNAAVSIKGAKKRTITDQAGFFKLYTLDPEFANQIIVNSTGYESFSEKLNSDSSYTNLIQLTPASAALNEVVVKKIPAEPAIGWDVFRNYIDSNKKILTADSILKGIEVISFVVNNKSELSSFKIDKSISPAHDAEIIRLMKAAPPLTLMKGKKKRLRISISFK